MVSACLPCYEGLSSSSSTKTNAHKQNKQKTRQQQLGMSLLWWQHNFNSSPQEPETGRCLEFGLCSELQASRDYKVVRPILKQSKW